ncbi:MAG: phage integrase SAM-like domain-containing protein [Clostridium sp.]|nr:phage integrase SAM-like domain-containing protein [Clostridium sp.]
MTNICKTVTLRTRPIKHGKMLSYYLDYYPGYRDETTMKVMRHESLAIYIYAKPKNRREREYNERMTEKAEALRCRRYESIVNERYDFFDKEKEKGDLLAYFRDLAGKRNTKWEHVYKHFERFVGGRCTFGEINVDLCRRFMDYLLNTRQYLHSKQTLHINSVAGYWSTFRACLHSPYFRLVAGGSRNEYLCCAEDACTQECGDHTDLCKHGGRTETIVREPHHAEIRSPNRHGLAVYFSLLSLYFILGAYIWKKVK